MSMGGRAGRFKVLVVVACFVGALVAPAVAQAGPTLVSLTFDDGDGNQYAARSLLAQHAMHATFYVNSGYVGTSGIMTWDQLSELAVDGNEIGGHTVHHVALTSVSTSVATQEVCDDRQTIISHGFTVTDFAYPSGDYNTSVESIVEGCGYSSARRSWGLCPIGDSLTQCAGEQFYKDAAERIPPQDVFATRTIQSIRAWNTLDDLENVVTRAEAAGGGWVTFVLHNVCDGCDPTAGYSISPSILSAFLDWLAPRDSTGTYVRTVRDVVSDETPPTSSIACNGAACSSSTYTAPVNISLAATDTGSGVAAIRYTTDGSDPTISSTLYSGPFSVSTTTAVKYRAWDVAGNVEATNTQLIAVDTAPADTTPPTSTIACNGAICSSGWYTPPVTVSLSATDPDDGVAAIRYTTDGSDPTTSSQLYVGAFTVTTTTTVKYRAWDVAGNAEATKSQLIQVDTFAPTVSITSPASGATLTGNIKIVAAPADVETGVASVKFYVDGVLLGTATGAPWQVPWNTRRSSSGQHVLTAVASDRAGNTSQSPSVTVTVK